MTQWNGHIPPCPRTFNTVGPDRLRFKCECGSVRLRSLFSDCFFKRALPHFANELPRFRNSGSVEVQSAQRRTLVFRTDRANLQYHRSSREAAEPGLFKGNAVKTSQQALLSPLALRRQRSCLTVRRLFSVRCRRAPIASRLSFALVAGI